MKLWITVSSEWRMISEDSYRIHQTTKNPGRCRMACYKYLLICLAGIKPVFWIINDDEFLQNERIESGAISIFRALLSRFRYSSPQLARGVDSRPRTVNTWAISEFNNVSRAISKACNNYCHARALLLLAQRFIAYLLLARHYCL